MNFLKGSALFGLGAALGFGCGWLFFKEKYRKIADEEIDAVKAYCEEKILIERAKIDKIEENSKKIDEVINTYTKDGYIDLSTLKKEEPHKKLQKTSYNKIGEKKEDEEVKAEKESPEEDEPTKPYLITEDEFLNDKNEYDKISLTYYIYDDTLADECDEMIDIEETVSTDIYNMLQDASDDLYVRNNSLETDFEIMRIEGSFHDRYGGY